jgi:hypothetical protein
MSMKKKVADFIRLEEGNIGKHAATVTGALLASTVLGAVLTQPVYALPCCHDQSYPHQDSHYNSHSNAHTNDSHNNLMDPGWNCTWCGPQ